MTDRELLELAAKAAGYTLLAEGKKPRLALHDDDPVYGAWNPLTDDGDALRLSVSLGLTVGFDDRFIGAAAFASYTKKNGDVDSVLEPISYCKSAATRRAIVRAAAEIGRGL